MGYHDGDFLVHPLDAVWFRDGRPFVAGESCFDQGMFPPSPWTFQGMIRTVLLRSAISGELDKISPDEIQRLVGLPDSLPRGWRIEGAFPAEVNRDEVWMPWFRTPRFLLKPNRKGDVPVHAHAKIKVDFGDDYLANNSPDMILLGNPGLDDSKPLGGWISASNLLWAFTGEVQWDHKGYAHQLPAFVKREARTGVRIERKRGAAADHMLYTAARHRFRQNSGLVGRLTGTSDASIPDNALWHNWCEAGRNGAITELKGPVKLDDSWERLRKGLHLQINADRVPNRMGIWVTLLTPALVTEAPHPFSNLEALSPRVKLIGRLAVEGAWIGGFNRIVGAGRQTCSFWATGSSWLFEINGGSPKDQLKAARILQGLDPYQSTELEALGFGQRVAGLINLNTYTSIRGDINDES